MTSTLLVYKEVLSRALSWSFLDFEAPQSKEKTLDLESAFSQYRQYYDDQIAIENSREVIGYLCCALMWMPNVKKVTISLNYYFFLDSYRYSRYFLEPELVYNKAFILLLHVLSLIDTKL